MVKAFVRASRCTQTMISDGQTFKPSGQTQDWSKAVFTGKIPECRWEFWRC